jgi:hypothetical protein
VKFGGTEPEIGSHPRKREFEGISIVEVLIEEKYGPDGSRPL